MHEATKPIQGEAEPGQAAPMGALPSEGEALITMATFAAALDVSESTAWQWSKSDNRFPTLVRQGPRFTRVRLSEARRYIAEMGSGTPKRSPRTRKAAEAVPA